MRIECCRRAGALIRAAAPAELSNLLNIEVASPFQYFGDQCCIESLGKLPPKGLGHYIVNVSAISPNSLLGLPGATAANTGSSNITTRRAGRPRTGNAGNGCPQSLSVFFFFWGGVRRPVALVAGLRRKNPAHRRKPATADNTPPDKLTGEKDQRKPCGAPLRTLGRPVERAEEAAPPHQFVRTTPGAVRASSPDAVRLGRRTGCGAARRSRGTPPTVRALGLVAESCRLLF